MATARSWRWEKTTAGVAVIRKNELSTHRRASVAQLDGRHRIGGLSCYPLRHVAGLIAD